ncbi:MAG: phenylalanine--tRNA ligase subunit beta [Candidatus Omnitrophota bacterium]
MKVTYNWLKEFVDIRLAPEALADRLSMAGLAVAACEACGNDWVFDIEVTSNRPDWLSVRGIAREVAAMTGRPLTTAFRAPSFKSFSGKTDAAVSIEDKKDCRLYFGRLITGVRVGASAERLKQRLEALGLRSVNNIVDITNYCLLEYGQPLHAFDWARVTGGVLSVRRARAGEILRLIDGSEKKLDPEILVIADAQKPLACAGIMGGRDSEVTQATTSILLESACFDPVVIRRGSRRMGMASDSSYRFERGVDVLGVRLALEAATRMIQEFCGGQVKGTVKAGSDSSPAASRIPYHAREAREILGLDVNAGDIAGILKPLGFVLKKQAGGRLEIQAPSFRKDVKVKEDVTEEIARIRGYDKIPLTQACIKPFSMEEPIGWALESRSRNYLAQAGAKEIITYSLLSGRDYELTKVELPAEALCLKNPLSQDFSILRTTLVPNLLHCASDNVKKGNVDLEIFEVGRIFASSKETVCVACLLCGDRRSSWTREARAYDFYDAKGICEGLFLELGIVNARFEEADEPYSRKGAGAAIFAGDKKAGFLGQVDESVKKAWDIKTKKDIFVFELDLSVAAEAFAPSRRFRAPASTPSISRDISILVSSRVPFESICALIRQKTQGYLRTIRLAERYEGKGLPTGQAALTIGLDYGREDKTLTDEEIAPIHKSVLDALTQELSLTLR